MDKVTHVEIVGGESGLGFVEFIASGLIALLAAGIAAVTAYVVMRRQLAHDREERDKEDARDTVYGALDASQAAMKSVHEYRAAIAAYQPALAHQVQGVAATEARRTVADQDARAGDDLLKLRMASLRIGTRLYDKELSDTLEQMTDDLRRVREMLDQGQQRTLTDAEWKDIETVSDRGIDGIAAFFSLCVLWFDRGPLEADDRERLDEYLAYVNTDRGDP